MKLSSLLTSVNLPANAAWTSKPDSLHSLLKKKKRIKRDERVGLETLEDIALRWRRRVRSW